jgi:hypothetical protein
VEENFLLTRPVTMDELEEVIRSMKTNSTPGLDGFFDDIFQKFLNQIAGESHFG